MRPTSILCVFLLAASTILLVPPAAACDQGNWDGNERSRQEAVGIGTASVGAYTQDRTSWNESDVTGLSNGCEGQSYAQRCQPQTTYVTIPDVRVLGETIYPGSQTPVTTPPAAYACLTGDTDYGVYVQGTGTPADGKYGTDLLLP